ncbi:MAG: FGGY-family carbohydrate kinase [bacterium]
MEAPGGTVGQKHVLAIDLGSGGPKVGVVGESGEVVASAVEKTTTRLLPGGGAEQDPEEWWQAIAAASRKVVRACGISTEQIIAVCCTTQWSVTVPVDENGKPLMHAVHWLDTRGAVYNRAICKGFPSIQGYGLAKLVRWVRLAGMPPTLGGSDALAHILFIQHERPEIYRKTYKFLEPMDYLSLRLTGRCASTLSNAFPLILTDNRDPECRDYDPALVRLAGIDRAKLPDLLANDGAPAPILPSVARELGLAPETRVTQPANDDHTAAIGAGAVRDFDPVMVLGTSGFLVCHTPRKKTDLIRHMTTMPSPIRGRHVLFCEMGGAGKSLEFFLNGLIYCQDGFGGGGPPPADAYERLDRMAGESPAGSGGVLFLPWLNGALVPDQDPTMRGGFLNLSNSTTRAHMSRAVLEAIAFNVRWLIDAARKFTGRRFPFLRLAGAGALSDVWAQIHADILGIPVHQMAEPRNANVRGAAFLAFDQLGYGSVEEAPEKVRVARICTPNPENRSLYDRMFQQFQAAYRKNKSICAALNGEAAGK